MTQKHPDLIRDFDFAYAYEAMMRVSYHLQDGQSEEWRKKAETAGESVADGEDRSIFDSDLGVAIAAMTR